jgi:F-type H+-transporting ATPase subunit gamma
MAIDIIKAESRLENIKAVTPVLAALRTISLGSWQMARSRSQYLDRYTDALLRLIPYLLPHLSTRRRIIKRRLSIGHGDEASPHNSTGERPVVAVVIGSERGLCGQYNQVLIDRLEGYLRGKQKEGIEVSLTAIGSRLIRELRRRDYEMDVTQALSATRLPEYDRVREFVNRWMTDYESYAIDAVDLLYNARAQAGDYHSRAVRLVPPSLSAVGSEREERSEVEPYPSTVIDIEDVIIETDPVELYAQIVRDWTTTTAYKMMLEAAGTEHGARYQLMESATQNAEALIDTLTRDIKSGRRRQITQEMQELAVAAGLLSE